MHILVEMEEMTFYSLEELNSELWKRMEKENRVNFSKLSYSRRDLFEKEEKGAHNAKLLNDHRYDRTAIRSGLSSNRARRSYFHSDITVTKRLIR
jgi:hypothetical protein